ncbi:MAG TPA: ABC transporter ATP-binding protein, partial [Acidimicrobiia bacterium]|nr:ABC transporter ATP-binding protein [Acidimicrobiia bacterium]
MTRLATEPRVSGALDARIVVRQGGHHLDVSLRVEPATTLAILGPNGAGKTTLLRAVAGLTSLEGGRVQLGPTVLDDPTSADWVPPDERSVGFVFQDDVLFPHLNARDNVAFGPRSRGVGRIESRRRADAWLERLDVAAVATHRPARLSGGQARRVALARALAAEPWLLLLDEPLTSLDAAARVATRALLRRHLEAHRGPCLLVTHDPLDALTLADSVLVLEAGVVVQRGTPDEIAARPRSRYAADLAGVNLLRGRVVDAGTVRLASGVDLAVADAEPAAGTAVVAIVHPRAVAL